MSLAKLRERLSIRRWQDIGWEFQYLFGNWNDQWYESLFNNGSGRITGEITPAYSCLPSNAIAHIKALMPDVRLILLLRDPIERAWSHARMDLMHRTGRRLPGIPEAEVRQHFDSIQSRIRGDYIGALDRWLIHFPSSQLFVGFYDEIVARPQSIFAQILQFLGVSARPEEMTPNLAVQVNPGREVSLTPELRRYLARIYLGQIRELAHRFGSYPVLWLQGCEAALS